MKVDWSPEAFEARVAIFDRIATDSVNAAVDMDEAFSAAAENLAVFPNLGKPGEVPGTRDLVIHENYRLVYEVHDQVVWIVAVVHSRMCWPPLGEDGF